MKLAKNSIYLTYTLYKNMRLCYDENIKFVL